MWSLTSLLTSRVIPFLLKNWLPILLGLLFMFMWANVQSMKRANARLASMNATLSESVDNLKAGVAVSEATVAAQQERMELFSRRFVTLEQELEEQAEVSRAARAEVRRLEIKLRDVDLYKVPAPQGSVAASDLLNSTSLMLICATRTAPSDRCGDGAAARP